MSHSQESHSKIKCCERSSLDTFVNEHLKKLISIRVQYSCFTMLGQLILYSKVSQLYVYIYPLFFGFPSHSGHHRTLSRVSLDIQQVLISYLFYTQYQQCMYGNPNLLVHPILSLLFLVSLHLFSMSLSLFCPASRLICTIFLDITYMC